MVTEHTHMVPVEDIDPSAFRFGPAGRRKKMGYLSVYYTVWCGHGWGECVTWENVEGKNRRAAGDDAKDKGWAYTRAFGWLCPEHA